MDNLAVILLFSFVVLFPPLLAVFGLIYLGMVSPSEAAGLVVLLAGSAFLLHATTHRRKG